MSILLWELSGEKHDAILSGNVNTLDINDELIIKYLHNLQQNENFPPISTVIPVSAVKSLFQKWKEATNMSPSGLHLGTIRPFYHRMVTNMRK